MQSYVVGACEVRYSEMWVLVGKHVMDFASSLGAGIVGAKDAIGVVRGQLASLELY